MYKSYGKEFRNTLKNNNKIHVKSVQNQPKWCQGVLLEQPWEQDGARLLKKALRLFIKFRLLVPLGRFWAPFGCPAGRQGAPKIKLIGIKLHQNLKK